MSKNVNRVPMSLRMPPEIFAWLKARADENGRSNNREIIQILKAAQQSEQCQPRAA